MIRPSLFIVAKNQKQSRNPLSGEWLSKPVPLYCEILLINKREQTLDKNHYLDEFPGNYSE